MRICEELGPRQMIFEGDCQVVVHAVNSEADYWTTLRPIVHYIRWMLQQNLDRKV